MKIAVVAGEPSGDYLGAGLIQSLSKRYPGACVEGIGGQRMTAAGLSSLFPMDALSVMGIGEVLSHLPQLLRIRRGLAERWLDDPPDLFIGVDSPDFNLPLAKRLKRAGVTTVQYVSPSVWAWRSGRVNGLRKALDCVLCILPFEPQFLAEHGIDGRFVGHPLADDIPLQPDRASARERLGIADAQTMVALLPGSRASEIKRLMPLYLDVAKRLQGFNPGCRFVLPAATPSLEATITQMTEQATTPPIQVVAGQAREVLAGADVALVASGTATLEAMLVRAPMVMAYRVNPLTALVVRLSLKTRCFALPNILAGHAFIPEFVQSEARAAPIATALIEMLANGETRAALQRRFASLHASLQCDAAERAAEVVSELLDKDTA
ncbi:lipid-A-disaccharide synthase [Spiribacter salinus]|uniref:lipid-A-disaccharide synthase n=1 Tax=Spiribacter salinus TaxID=1335746 RepID=UPI001C95832C|nr:lipid-A-disaccharide synthase [Spiribacter salinus]